MKSIFKRKKNRDEGVPDLTINRISKKADIVLNICFSVWTLACVLPLLLVVIVSFSSEQSIFENGYSFFPSEWSLAAYEFFFKLGDQLIRSYGITIFVTVVGTLFSLAISASFAYVLSRSDYAYNRLFTLLMLFTMLFNGGIVPQYIMWTTIFHVRNTYAALIFPNLLMTAFNIFLVRNYYTNSIPDALYEAAQLDGATEIGIFSRVVFPLAKPVVATIALFTGLSYWNSWTNALYYVQDPKYFGIQNLLMRIMKNIEYLRTGATEMAAEGQAVSLPGNSIRMALAFIGLIPILILYPMMQKYFIKGVVVGAVKG